MVGSRVLACVAIVTVVTGCAEKAAPIASTMNRTATLRMDARAMSMTEAERQLEEQADALQSMTRDIVRKSTLRGAGVGAVAGCGLALLSATSATRCVGGAIIGGAAGGIAGNAIGKHRVNQRVQLIKRDDAARAISRASARMGTVKSRLSELIATQDAERAELKIKLARGLVTQEMYDGRIAAMQQNRAALAEALALSATQAAKARRLLLEAQRKGQDGLDWHLAAAQRLEANAISARSNIQLF